MAAMRSANNRQTKFSNLRLYQLTGLEREKIVNEYKELVETINDLRDILAKEQRVFTIIKKELREIRDKYGSPRLTEIVPDRSRDQHRRPHRQ